MLRIIREKRVKKLKEIEIENLKKEKISFLAKFIDKSEVRTWDINLEEYLEIFSDNSFCHPSTNYIRSYENHIKNCLFKKEEIEKFSLILAKKLEDKGKLVKFRSLVINDIQDKIDNYNKSNSKSFASFSGDWKEKIVSSSEEDCLLIKDSLFKEINDCFKKVLSEEKIKLEKGNDKVGAEKVSFSNNQLEELADVLDISKDDLNLDKLKEEIKKLKKEKFVYKSKFEKSELELKLLKKQKELNIFKRGLYQKANSKKIEERF